MIFAQIRGDDAVWILRDRKAAEEAAACGAEIIQDEEDGRSVLFDGERWVGKEPDFSKSIQTLSLASQGYVDERMRLLLNLMEKSIAPALAVILPSARKNIQREYDAFRDLIEEGNNGNV